MLHTPEVHSQDSPSEKSLNAYLTGGPYDELWKEVYAFELGRRPKEARKAVLKIYDKALKNGNKAERIKALLFEAKFSALLDENGEWQVIDRLRAGAEEAEGVERMLLLSYLNELYRMYFSDHQWKIMDRTEVSDTVPAADFRFWDAPRFFREMKQTTLNSLADPELLKAESTSRYLPLFDTIGKDVRLLPTLYDILSKRVLEHLKDSRYSPDLKSADRSYIDASYLGSADVFLTAELPENDSSSTAHIFRIYRKLTRLNRDGNRPDRLARLNLERVGYAYSLIRSEQKEVWWQSGLESLIDSSRTPVERGHYLLSKARMLRDKGGDYDHRQGSTNRLKLKEAVAVCEEIQRITDDPYLVSHAKNLKEELYRPRLSLTSERYVYPDKESLFRVEYSNLDSLYLSVFRVPHDTREYYNTSEMLEDLPQLTGTPLRTWGMSLPESSDLQKHSAEFVLPALESGTYMLLAHPCPTVLEPDFIASQLLQVTSLTLLVNTMEGIHELKVRDRWDGTPKAGARILVTDTYRGGSKKLKTDDYGEAGWRHTRDYSRVNMSVSLGEDTLHLAENVGAYGRYRSGSGGVDESIRFHLFTDRTLYRPGHKAYVKVIGSMHDEEVYRTLSGESVKLSLSNPNGEEVFTQTVELNELGSAHTEIDLPGDGLTGSYSLRASPAEETDKKFQRGRIRNGYTSLRVEAYKRPTFFVEFPPTEGDFSLGDSLNIKGLAKAYSGSLVTEADVRYRVTRGLERPYWWYRWYGDYSGSEETEISSGTSRTDAEGSFVVPFRAKAEADGEPSPYDIFVFTVYAEVTDLNGETRTQEERVRIGRTRLKAGIEVESLWSTLDDSPKIEVSTTNLNGDFSPATGTLSIYPLQGPKHPKRERKWDEAEFPSLDRETFDSRFPYEYYMKKETRPVNWPRGPVKWETPFDSAKETVYRPGSLRNWQPGTYLLELLTQDSEGNEVVARDIIQLENPKSDILPVAQSFWSRIDKQAYEPGEQVVLKIGSSLPVLSMDVWIEKDHRITQKQRIILNNAIKEVRIPVTEADRGGFVIWLQAVGQNEHYSRSQFIRVNHPDTELKIVAETFRDKIQPGGSEKWLFRLLNPDGTPAAAEVLASMYDASLDAIEPFSWSFNPIEKPVYYSRNSQGSQAFDEDSWTVSNLDWSVTPRLSLSPPTWTDFGLNTGKYWQYNSYLSKLRQYFPVQASATASYDPDIPAGTVRGTVLDENGDPLPGASVIVKGTSFGTQTDFDGNFSIPVQKGQSLVISYIGYPTTEYAIKRDNSLVFNLQSDNAALEEVVIVGYGEGRPRRRMALKAMAAEAEEGEADMLMIRGQASGVTAEAPPPPTTAPDSVQAIDLSSIEARTNLQETAFFKPQLRTNEKGEVLIEFESPEALTQWNVWLLAHDRNLNNAYRKWQTVTQKELMVSPNMPRFLREGDRVVLRAKISNLSEDDLSGQAQLELTDPTTGENLDGLLSQENGVQTFEVGQGGNTVLSWEVSVPPGLQALQYRVVAGTGTYSDGQQDALPVLTNRTLVTETLPLWVNGKESRSFSLNGLKNADSPTLTNHQYTVEVSSNPVWYAVQSLPYLMEFPYECSEQTFARIYANTLGSHIGKAFPQIRETWESWANAEVLESKLEKNQELKALIIEETPWLRDAQSETEQKKRMGNLFRDDHMQKELRKALRKLEDMQFSEGGFPWFKGSRYPSRNVTQHIVSGFGHLKVLGVWNKGDMPEGKRIQRMTERAISYMDQEIAREYDKLIERADKIEKEAKTQAKGRKARTEFLAADHLHWGVLQYLYARSFFSEYPIPDQAEKATRYYHEQLIRYWDRRNLYSWAMAGLYLIRSGEMEEAGKILTAIDQLSVHNEELGTYWKENVSGWYWYQAPVETQSLLIELYSEYLPEGPDKEARIGGMQTWLLKQKQTRNWKTTKATTEAIYALLRGGTGILEEKKVELQLGGRPIVDWGPEQSEREAGTGYVKFSFGPDQVSQKMSEVTIVKSDEGPAWGAAYWQYFEDLDKVSASETSLKLRKQIFRRTFDENGEILVPVGPDSPLRVGDLLRIRIELESDRHMEFLHMKDYRAASFEPVETLSRYRYQEGLWYYQSTRDASTHFFIENMEKGSYVFEYELRVAQEGEFSNGYALIQSMYAPEFSSHSDGQRVRVSSE